jgi:hypothetical protein
VKLAKVLLGLLKELDGLVDVGHVGLDGNRLAAHLANLFAHGLGSSRAVGVVDDNVGATTSKLKSHFLANATACVRC